MDLHGESGCVNGLPNHSKAAMAKQLLLIEIRTVF